MADDDTQEIRRTLQNLLPGTTYSTRVRALNEFGQYSDWSEALEFTAEASASASYTLVAPPAPSVQSLINAIMITMSYTAQNDGISTYVLEHSLDNISFSEIARPQVPLFVHQVPPGVTHYYRFKVVDVYGTTSPVSPSNSGQSVSSVSFYKPYATIVVAAYNSSAPGKANADFVCDGVDDHITLNAAAVAATEEGYIGKVILLDGLFYVGAPVDEAATVSWEGMGPVCTDIHVTADMSSTIFPCMNMSNLTIYGYGDDAIAKNVASYARVVDGYESLTNVHIKGFDSDTECASSYGPVVGLRVEDGGTGFVMQPGCMVSNSHFEDCVTGVAINGPLCPLVGSNFNRCQEGVIAYAGGTIVGNEFTECDISIHSFADTSIVGNRFERSYPLAVGVAILDDYASVISGNTFVDCGVQTTSYGQGHVTGNHFQVGEGRVFHAKAGSECSFTNNRVYSSGTIPPIRIDNSTTNTLIDGNWISTSAAAFSDAGVGTNYGGGNYVNNVWVSTATDKHYTHTQGSASTTWTVTHNLSKYPTIVTVNTSDTVIHGTITYNSNMQATVVFSTAVDGKAYCN